MESKKDWAAEVSKIPYWYHRIELPDGTITPGWAPIDASKYQIPEDLTGKRVLDIGAWDGYWTWEALKRGAKEVVAIDDFSDNLGQLKERGKWETFDLCREAFGFTKQKYAEGWENDKGQIVHRLEYSIYDIVPLGAFDVVFFFGTFYHLKNPYLAMEAIAKVCTGELYIESAILDDFSPYRGGLHHGYPDHDMIMEFYPGREYGGNYNNWWVPTVQCLGSIAASVGFNNIRTWALTDNPQSVGECRGFLYANKLPEENKQAAEPKDNRLKNIACLLCTPRIGFMDNQFCLLDAMIPLKISVVKVTGVFWTQNIDNGLRLLIDKGHDAIFVVDYDTLFTIKDVQEIIRLMNETPDATAIMAMQMGRSGQGPLITLKGKSGRGIPNVPREMFNGPLTKVATANFGLCLLRVSDLLKMPAPWFKGEPNPDGLWGEGRTDSDIWFWRQLYKHELNAYVANRVPVGHMELVSNWPNEDLKPLYQNLEAYQKHGKPEGVWK